MAPADPTIPSLVLAAVVLATALYLTARQWSDRQSRADSPSETDAEYFARQDVRRFVGAAVMAVIALGIVVGSRINHRVAGGQHRVFVWVWIGVFVLIFVLLILAGRDWLDTLGYARRQAQGDCRRAPGPLRVGTQPSRPPHQRPGETRRPRQ